MKFKFTGVGSAFTHNNYQTNCLIEKNGQYLLIDAGSDIRFALKDLELSYKDIESVYVTHLHGDHVGGLEYLAFCSYFDPSVEDKPCLIGNNRLIRELWSSTLKGGLKSIQGKKTSLDDFFDVQMVSRNGKFIWQDIVFQTVQSVHIMDEYSIVPSFGLMITDPETELVVYYTGDTQFNPNQIMDFYNQADIVFQDCETYPFKSGVHANYSELVTLPDEVKAKMILMHMNDNIFDGKDVSTEWQNKAQDDGFWSFAMSGYDYDLSKMAKIVGGEDLDL